jgi:hypothetical protein
MRFIKFLFGFLLLELAGICMFRASLIQVQAVVCVVSVLLFLTNIGLVLNTKRDAKP